jgi:hypothetical protein
MQLKSVISVFTVALATQAFAQEDAVVVVATRFPEKRLEHPIGVTVITREQIANSPAANLPELLSGYAGVNMRNNTGSPDVALDMRGFGVSGDAARRSDDGALVGDSAGGGDVWWRRLARGYHQYHYAFPIAGDRARPWAGRQPPRTTCAPRQSRRGNTGLRWPPVQLG